MENSYEYNGNLRYKLSYSNPVTSTSNEYTPSSINVHGISSHPLVTSQFVQANEVPLDYSYRENGKMNHISDATTDLMQRRLRYPLYNYHSCPPESSLRLQSQDYLSYPPPIPPIKAVPSISSINTASSILPTISSHPSSILSSASSKDIGVHDRQLTEPNQLQDLRLTKATSFNTMPQPRSMSTISSNGLRRTSTDYTDLLFSASTSKPEYRNTPQIMSVDSAIPLDANIRNGVGSHTSFLTSNITFSPSDLVQGLAEERREKSESGEEQEVTKRERNRIAAKRSRQRKLDRIQQLTEEQKELQERYTQLKKENEKLEKTLKDHILHTNQHILSSDEIKELVQYRTDVICSLAEAYTNGNIKDVVKHFADDCVISGPQSPLLLRGKDAFIYDYVCTRYLYRDFRWTCECIHHDGSNNQHYRVTWVFSGILKSAGKSHCPQFVGLVQEIVGKRITFNGCTNVSFDGKLIVYMHHSIDQGKFLSQLLGLCDTENGEP